MTAELQWTDASRADEETLLALMQAFYAEEGLVFRPDAARAAVREILGNPQIGSVFLLKEMQHEALQGAVGYVAVAFWHCMEFGGRVALLDEFYIAPALRGRGWAPKALDFVRDWARAQQCVAVRLEVNHHNARAKRIYTEAGYSDDRRDILTLRL